MRLLRSFVPAFLLMVSATAAQAQGTPATAPLKALRLSLAEDILERDRPFSLVQDIDYIAVRARPTGALIRLLEQFEQERSDKQIGATSSSQGTTTLVSKGTVPRILALALENGAVTRSQSASVVTFRTNMGGALRALAGKAVFPLSPGNDTALALLDRVAFSASFDTSRGATDPNTFTGNEQQLSQWTGRLQLVNHRDPSRAQFLEKSWQPRVDALVRAVSTAGGPLYDALEADPAIAKWAQDTAVAIEAARTAPGANAASVERALEARDAAFPAADALQPQTRAALAEYDRTTSRFVQERHDVLRELGAGALLVLEYSSDRPIKAPTTSNIRLAGEVGALVDLTGNVSVTLFDQIPFGAEGRIRDFQMSGQMDFKLGSADTVGAFIVSLSGKYLRQLENSFNEVGVMVPNTKGTTAMGQLKLTIPAGKSSGAKIPLSITFANRTDLVKEAVVRANVGITYDLDQLFARFRP